MIFTRETFSVLISMLSPLELCGLSQTGRNIKRARSTSVTTALKIQREYGFQKRFRECRKNETVNLVISDFDY